MISPRAVTTLYLVTGAASGLGRSLALELARRGHALLLTDVDEAGLFIVASACRTECARVEAFACDVTSPGEVHRHVLSLAPEWHLPDVIIANAGLGGINPGYAFSMEMDRKVMAVNYDGMVQTLMPFVPAMIERGRGALVGICSLAGLRGLPNASSYCASKAAQMTFLESIRVDLAAKGITVTCIHPGFIRTPMTAHDEFPMPFMVTSEAAARVCIRAIERGLSQVYFPTLLGWVSRLNRFLPNWLSDWLALRVAGGGNRASRIFSKPD